MVKIVIVAIAFGLCSFLGAISAQAGESDGGRIVHIASVGNTILFKIGGGNDANRPACATSGRFAVNKDSSHAAVVLTAFTKGSMLANVRGLGTCSQWGNAEDIQWVEVCPLNGCF